jgi:uncharacterized protein (TIGR00369 family)
MQSGGIAAKGKRMTELPPYANLLQLRTEEQADGSLMFVMPFHDDVIGRPQYLHGGAIAGLLEFAAYGTLRRAIDNDNVVMKPITVTVDYMLGGKDRETYATAVIERLGRSVANVEAFAWQADRSRPIASARINFLLDRGQ